MAVDAQGHDGELPAVTLGVRIVLAPLDHEVVRGERAGERIVRGRFIERLLGRLQFLVRSDELEDVMQP